MALAGDTTFLTMPDSLDLDVPRLWLASFLSHALREESGPRALAAHVARCAFVDSDDALIVRFGPLPRDGALGDVLRLVEPAEAAAFDTVYRDLAASGRRAPFSSVVRDIRDAADGDSGASGASVSFADIVSGVVKLLDPQPAWNAYTNLWKQQRDNLQKVRDTANLLPGAGEDGADDVAEEVRARVLAYYATLAASYAQLATTARRSARFSITEK